MLTIQLVKFDLHISYLRLTFYFITPYNCRMSSNYLCWCILFSCNSLKWTVVQWSDFISFKIFYVPFYGLVILKDMGSKMYIFNKHLAALSFQTD